MKQLIKHLRPFSWYIVAIFIFLFGQAMSELSLPSYMSNIVNVGIQQGGIENAVPEVIRATELEKLKLFMTETETQQVAANYTLLNRQSLSEDDYTYYVKTYPELANTAIYKLNTDDENEIVLMDSIFSRYITVLSAIENGSIAEYMGNDFSIPAGTDPFALISQLPPAQLDAMRDTMTTQLNSIPESLLKQYSIAYLTTEYKALGMDVNAQQTHYMLRIGLFMLLLTLASALCSISVGYLSARVASGLGRNLRRQLFERVESFSSTEFDKFSTASLITRSTNDITQIQMLMVMLLRIVFYAPIMGIGGIIKVINADRTMLSIIAGAVGVIIIIMIIMFKIALPKFQLVQKLVDKLNLVTREMLTGLMVIRAFNKQKHEEEKFDVVNSDLTKTNLFVNRIMVLIMPVMMLLMNGIMVLIVWVGSHQIDIGSMQVGDMMAFMQYAMQIIMSFLMISIIFIMVPRASVSAERISEVLEAEPVIKDPQKALDFSKDLQGVVEFQDVSFRYPEAEDDVLKHITFTAKPGQTTAFIGSTGSGKSTLINLIPRFYDVTSGKVMIDGVDVREVTQHDLRAKIGYVAQKAVLFSGTIASNVRYANEQATDDEIARYIEIAQASDLISGNSKGLATDITQGGTNFSGGQKQRLAIARALAKKPEIYIFDDSLSALDFKTDAALRKALRKETSTATLLIVTQRVSTIMNADQIVVLDNGEIAGIGTHKELMQNCNVYRETVLSQLSGKELSS